MTRFRTGLIIGLGVGYVLGTKAGRERYEQLMRTAQSAWRSAPAEKMRSEVTSHMPDAVTNAMSRIDKMRHPNGEREMITAGLPA